MSYYCLWVISIKICLTYSVMLCTVYLYISVHVSTVNHKCYDDFCACGRPMGHLFSPLFIFLIFCKLFLLSSSSSSSSSSSLFSSEIIFGLSCYHDQINLYLYPILLNFITGYNNHNTCGFFTYNASC